MLRFGCWLGAISCMCAAPNPSVRPIELAAADPGRDAKPRATWPTEWKLRDLLPSDDGVEWTHAIDARALAAGEYVLLMRVVNPLPGGIPMRFANAGQDADLPGWLTLGRLQVGD